MCFAKARRYSAASPRSAGLARSAGSAAWTPIASRNQRGQTAVGGNQKQSEAIGSNRKQS